MWYNTNVSALLNIKFPVLQGPFGGGISSANLVSRVSNAGGLGGYGAYQLSPDEIVEVDKEIRSLTNRPYNINLWVNDVDENAGHYNSHDFKKLAEYFAPFFSELNIPIPPQPKNKTSKFEQQAETLLRIKPPVFSFVFGIPDVAILKACREQNIVTIGCATTIDEAVELECAGVDLIVASGFEAGGHRPSFLRSVNDSLTGTFVLVQQLANEVRTPIIAAGGIANANGIKAAFALGATGVQIGTAFLACKESIIPPAYRTAIFSERSKYTTLTSAFTGRPGRGTMSIISKSHHVNNCVAPFPLQTEFMSLLRKTAIEQNKSDLLTFWMGQIASIVEPTSATVFMEELIASANKIM